MEMDATFLGETFKQRDPDQISPPDIPQPRQDTYHQPDTVETPTNTGQLNMKTVLHVEGDTHQISSIKPTPSSINILSQKELETLKKTNLRAYMKMVLSSKGSSTDKCSSSSTVFWGNIGPETLDGIFHQLKTQLSGVDLSDALGKYFLYGYVIKPLLKKLDVPDATGEVVDFVVSFGPLFDHTLVDQHSC